MPFSIDEFKSAVSKGSGLAKPNLFNIYLPPLDPSVSTKELVGFMIGALQHMNTKYDNLEKKYNDLEKKYNALL